MRGTGPSTRTAWQTMQSPILIADDDPEQLQEISEFLARRGFDTVTAGDGHEAVEMIVREKPRVLILDVNMPGWDGVRVAQAARGLDHRIIVILMTGDNDAHFRASLADCGAVEVFHKPVQIQHLVKFLEDSLGQRACA